MFINAFICVASHFFAHRMALATSKEPFYSPNDVNLVIISFQIVKNQSCHMMPKYFAEHSRRGMATISLRPVKVSSFYPIFISSHAWTLNMRTQTQPKSTAQTFTLPSERAIYLCLRFSFDETKKQRKRERNVSTPIWFCSFFFLFRLDNMIRIYDSTTMRYKCQNEIIARDMNWCILDIAFSPGSEYFIYSTWSSCCKCWNMSHYRKRKEKIKFKSKIQNFHNHLRNRTVHLSRINGTSQQLKPLYLQPSKSSFCIFSLAFSNCGDQIIGGGSDGCLYIYDLVMAKRTFRCPVSTRADTHTWYQFR